MRELILKPPQVPMTQWLMNHLRAGLWAGMGIGKTSAELVVLDWLRLLGELDYQYPALVFGPMRVARDTWPDEVRKWEQFKDLEIIPLVGTPDERKKLLKRRAHVFTSSYELAPWLVEQWLERWPYRIVVADEADRLMGFRMVSKHETKITSKKSGKSGKQAFQIARIAHNLTDRWVNLTGTPGRLIDLWGQTWFLDRGARLGKTFGAFKNRWFRKKWNSEYGIEAMPHAEKEIHGLLRDIYLTVDPTDYFNLEKPIYNRVEVKLPPAARKLYTQAREEMYIEIEGVMASGEGINIVNAGVLSQKCLQIANGALYTERPVWAPIHGAKLEALDSIVHEASGEPIMVAYNFRHDLERILDAFPQAVDISTPKGLAMFKAGKRTLGVAHPKSMGHGIDGLQYVCNRLVYFGHGWKTRERQQILERIGPMRQLQAELERPVWVSDIIAVDTEDENVMRVHYDNVTVQQALLDAMNRRRT